MPTNTARSPWETPAGRAARIDLNTQSERSGKVVEEVDHSWNWIYQVGGLCVLLAGILYVVGAGLGWVLGVPPGNTTAFLQAVTSHPVLAMTTYGVFGLTDILLIIGMGALYLALKGLHKNAMLVAALLVIVFYIVDLATFIPNSMTLATLTQSYGSAVSDAQRTALLGAEHYILATIPLSQFAGYVLPSVGFLITAIVMFKGVFGKHTGRLGILANALGIVGGFYFLFPVMSLSLLLTPCLVLYGLWLIAAGRRLYMLGKTSGVR